MEGQRKIWIDWAKTLSIFAIVWGHCFPEGLCGFIYAFNVPVFFIISGYLCHREASFGKCFDKTLHNLIIPYFILAAIKVAGPVIKHIGDGEWIWSVAAVLGGFHSLNDAPGCSNLWFVYSLVIVKLLFQVSSGKRDIALAMACLAGAVVYNDILHLEWRWAVSNCPLAYPFFIIGNSLRDNDILQRLVTSARQYRYVAALAAALLIAVTYIVGTQNGQAKLYMGQYANNIVLFAIGALTGSMAVFVLSALLDGVRLKITRVISSGTIVILVFHRELLHPLLKEIGKTDTSSLLTVNTLVFISAVIVVMAFYPIILLVKRFIPMVLGRRKM
ncbi:MAG: acyltransferase family protein [Bacteroidales bacterium]